MKKRSRIILLAATCAVVVAAAALTLIAALSRDTTLDLRVRDSVSGRWVWGAQMRLQDRSQVAFFQSDAGLKTYRFTHLSPGRSTLEIGAAGYQAVSLPVTLRRGANTLKDPIDMRGLGIPDLAKFFVFERLEGRDILAQLRPVSVSGAAIINHPAMDLWIGCRVSVQVKGGIPVIEETDAGSGRGRELFRGQVPWTWDPAPETQFRYTARIPGERIADDPSLYRVIDYLIVEPDPLKITRAELDDLMARVFALEDPARMEAALQAEKDRVHSFVDASWNVRARP